MHSAVRRGVLPSRKVIEINPRLYTVTPNQITFYVRNQPFSVNLSALKRSGSPLLLQLAGGRPFYHPIIEGEDGQISIDRDPEAFNFIVRALSNPLYFDLEAIKSSKCGVAGVLAEAQFFELRDLEKKLKEHIAVPPAPPPAPTIFTNMLIVRGSTPPRTFAGLICSDCVKTYPISWSQNVEVHHCAICREKQMKIQYAASVPEQEVDSFDFDIAKALKPVTAADQALLLGECMDNLSKIRDNDTRVALSRQVRDALNAGNVLVKSAFFTTSGEFMAVLLGPPPAVVSPP